MKATFNKDTRTASILDDGGNVVEVRYIEEGITPADAVKIIESAGYTVTGQFHAGDPEPWVEIEKA